MIINTVAAVISFYYPVTWIFPTLILAGGLVTLITLRKKVVPLTRSMCFTPSFLCLVNKLILILCDVWCPVTGRLEQAINQQLDCALIDMAKHRMVW